MKEEKVRKTPGVHNRDLHKEIQLEKGQKSGDVCRLKRSIRVPLKNRHEHVVLTLTGWVGLQFLNFLISLCGANVHHSLISP